MSRPKPALSVEVDIGLRRPLSLDEAFLVWSRSGEEFILFSCAKVR